jgi:hypothetical protein
LKRNEALGEVVRVSGLDADLVGSGAGPIKEMIRENKAMAFLAITDTEKERIKEILGYASGHVLAPDFGDKDFVLIEPDPTFYRLELARFDCDFCFYSRRDGRVVRQLEIRMPRTGAQVSPLRIAILGELFGFKGWKGLGRPIPKDWHYHYQREQDAFVISQEKQS